MVSLHFISHAGKNVKPVAVAANAMQIPTISHAFHHFSYYKTFIKVCRYHGNVRLHQQQLYV
jgi:hypothetical protein